MDIRGLILVNNEEAEGEQRLALKSVPLALLDVAGVSPLLRTAQRLESFAISPVTAIVEGAPTSLKRALRLPPEIDCRTAPADRFWRAAESAFGDLVQSGAEIVLLVRLGAYAEIDFERFIQFHLERRCHVSRVAHESAAVQIFCLSASRRNDAASLFRSGLIRCRSECASVLDEGYVNPLSDARDLRQFAIDLLTLKTQSRPAGREVRPGIWMGNGACVEKGARIIAPAFVGASARVRDSAVITRSTTIEHHAQVDCGTVVENCTVLPYTRLGAGLDLAHSLAGFGHIINLRRGATAEVVDPRILGQASERITPRLVGAAMSLPRRVLRGVNAPARRPEPALDSGPRLVPDTSRESAGELASNLAIARRYGNE
jgi:hypothetical protein